MATSRPLRDGDLIVCCAPTQSCGTWAHFVHYLRGEPWFLASDFGISNGGDLLKISERMFGVPEGFGQARVGMIAAITNGTAPGLYVREGDDTSDWETYRRVLARRVEEAMATRRGGVGERATVAETATTRQDDEIRVGDVVEVVSCRSTDWTTVTDVGTRGRVTEIDESVGTVHLESYRGQRLPQEGIAGLADVRKVTPPSPQTVASPMPDGEVARIEAAVTDGVRRRSVVDDMRRASLDETIQPAGRRDVGSSIGQVVQREIDRLYGRAVASPLTTAASPPAPPSPSRFSLLEVDTDAAPAPAPQAPKPSTGLAALQQELRAEREAKRALAAAQTPPGRFDLLECDLPAVPTVAVKAPPKRPVVSSSPSPPQRPVETITDLTTARSPLELARMLEGLNDELSTMMRQREAN